MRTVMAFGVLAALVAAGCAERTLEYGGAIRPGVAVEGVRIDSSYEIIGPVKGTASGESVFWIFGRGWPPRVDVIEPRIYFCKTKLVKQADGKYKQVPCAEYAYASLGGVLKGIRGCTERRVVTAAYFDAMSKSGADVLFNPRVKLKREVGIFSKKLDAEVSGTAIKIVPMEPQRTKAP